jgi:Tol biopolymer transport system component
MKGEPATVAPDGTDRRVIELGSALAASYTTQPHWSPDGTRIVLAVYQPPEQQSDLWTVAADGGDPIQVTDSAGSEQWPDWGPGPTVP